MGGLFQGITNAFGGLLGETDAQYAQKQAQNSANQQSALQQQYGQQANGIYGFLANQGQGIASNNYNLQAGISSSNLVQQGKTQYDQYSQNYLPLLQMYGSEAGLGNNTLSGIAPTDQSKSNPYGLDQNQQALLNQSQAQIANAKRSAISSAQQELAANGITDPRSTSLISEQLDAHFSQLQADTQAKFYEQVKQDKLAAIKDVLGSLQGYGQQGISEQEAGASGLLSANQQGIQQQEAAGNGYLGLSSGAQNAYLAQQQNALSASQANDSAFGGLLQLAGFGFGGGFSGLGGGGTPAIPGVSSAANQGVAQSGAYPSY